MLVAVTFSAQVFLMTKVAGASEPATYTFGMDAAADRYSIALYSIKGADTSSIFDGVVPTLTELAATSSPVAAGITTTNDNSLVISGFFYDSANVITYSAPTNGFTEDFDLSGSQAQAAFSKIQTTAGAVGDMSATSSTSPAQASWMFAINAAGPASETATTGNIPLAIQAGYTKVDLVDPVTTNASLLFGFTGDTPVTGDDLEYDVTSTLDSGVTLSVAATGVWTVTEAVSGDWVTDITVVEEWCRQTALSVLRQW